MSPHTRIVLFAAALLSGAPVLANDFPTVDRVNYVLECMRTHPGPHYEMVSKCSCALDAMAREIKHDEYNDLSTAANANSIGGERGNTIRDTDVLQKKIRKYRALQNKVKTGCFINLEAR